MGDSTVLKTINQEATKNRLRVYQNIPGFILMDGARESEDDPKRRKITRERRETVYNEPTTDDERDVSEERIYDAEALEDDRDDDEWEGLNPTTNFTDNLL
eukprot:gene3301-4155_t